MPLPHTFAAHRPWSPETALDLSKHPLLDTAWINSQRLLRQISDQLQTATLDPRILTVAASGSLGRMEAVAGSDADLIVVLSDEITTDSPQAQQACDSVWEALEALQLPHSRRGGIFSIPTTPAALCNVDARGKIDEDIPTFGKRFQLFCDAQPVYDTVAYEQLLSDTIRWYTAATPGDATTAWWRYLLNDLLRYYRSMCVAAQWDQSHGVGFQRMRNFKHAHSRTVMYAGLLCLLGEGSSVPQDPLQQFQAMLRLTPLERLAWSCPSAQEADMTAIATIYARYLEKLDDPTFRQSLLDDNLTEAHTADWTQSGHDLRNALSRFLDERRQQWAPEFAAALWF
ncbi:DUF294 nucleotidyltransferase-like domain-containing protein [Symmachiella dynata]|uniref:DUF294 nucleotidyltransferase-like domain-containing protein n=1 Tax=Symmachiella dynata TaxID=2527995 RepID=UPI0030EE239E